MKRSELSFTHELIDQEAIFDYIHGGNAIVTLESDTGVHRTYRFFKGFNSKFDKALFVKVMAENGVFEYVGMIKNNHFRLTQKSAFPFDSPEVRGVYYILKLMLQPGGYHDDRMRLYHSGVCSVCGRKLTSPKSIITGMGKECRRKLRISMT